MVFFQEKLLAEIDKQKIEKILSLYGKFNLISYQPKSGFQNLGLKLETRRNIFIFRIHRKISFQRLESILGVIEYLLNLGMPVPKPIKTQKNKKIISVRIGNLSYFAVLFQYLDGEVKVFLTDSEISEFGELVGKLHWNLDKLHVDQKFQKLNLKTLSTSVKKQILAEFENQSEIIKPWRDFWSDAQKILSKNHKFLLKRQLVHGDLAPSNIVFKNSEISGILDFDNLIFAPKTWDLANFVVSHYSTLKSYGGQKRIRQILESLTTGYCKFFFLTEEEKQLLPIIIRLLLFKKTIWVKHESSKKYRKDWASWMISWLIAALKEKF